MNALVIVARGLHLGYLGCYGNEWVETPALDRLAAEGVVFDQHYADQPDADGAQRAWQTGHYHLPALGEENEVRLPEAAHLFPSLAEQGAATFYISDSRGQPGSSIPADWQQVFLLEPAGANRGLPQQIPDALAKALSHLTASRHWLLRLDLGTLLPPWHTPEEFLDRYTSPGEEEERDTPLPVGADSTLCEPEETRDLAHQELQNRYAAAVTHLDTGIGQVLHECEQRGLLEEMLVLVTSDGGQKLGEDAMRRGPKRSLHEESIHLPLLLRLPGKAEAGRRVFALTQSVDLLPTVFEAFGMPLPAAHGHSLLPLARGQGLPVRPYACTGLRAGDTVEWALRSPDWYFLLPVSSAPSDPPLESELYVKPDDRWEVNNVRQHHLEFAEQLEQTLRGFVDATRRPGPLRPPELPRPVSELARE